MNLTIYHITVFDCSFCLFAASVFAHTCAFCLERERERERQHKQEQLPGHLCKGSNCTQC